MPKYGCGTSLREDWLRPSQNPGEPYGGTWRRFTLWSSTPWPETSLSRRLMTSPSESGTCPRWRKFFSSLFILIRFGPYYQDSLFYITEYLILRFNHFASNHENIELWTPFCIVYIRLKNQSKILKSAGCASRNFTRIIILHV